MTTKTKKRYLCIDWEARSVSTYDTMEEMFLYFDSVADASGSPNESQSTEDLDISVYSVFCAQRPKQDIYTLEVKREWKV